MNIMNIHCKPGLGENVNTFKEKIMKINAKILLPDSMFKGK